MDIRYGYITGEDKLVYLLNSSHILDEALVTIILEYTVKLKILEKCLIRRNLFEEKVKKTVIGKDNNPRFASHKFSECYAEIKIEYERILGKILDKSAHLE